MSGLMLVGFLLALCVMAARAQDFGPFIAEGKLTGCYLDGATPVITMFFSNPMSTFYPGPVSLSVPIPAGVNPNVVEPTATGLLIQMGGIAQISVTQLCNGFTAPPLPGTSPVDTVPGQEQYYGIFGSTAIVSGLQEILPECNPVRAGVVCNPAKAPVILQSINVIVEEELFTGVLIPSLTPGFFTLNKVPCAPMVYNYPPLDANLVSINARVIDLNGFAVDPATLPVQSGVMVEGWYSTIQGENTFYYYQATVPFGTRLPGQFIVVTSALCDQATDSIRVTGAVSTGDPALAWPLAGAGVVTLSITLTPGVVQTIVPTLNEGAAVPTATFNMFYDLPDLAPQCPRSVTVGWRLPAGLALPAGAVTSLVVPTTIVKN